MGPRFSAALAFAHELHGSQLRKGTKIPYIAHLLAVASLVIENGGDEDTAIAALLHDAVEDQGGRQMLERIRARFGDAVADVVDECSDTDVSPKPPWKARKKAYLDAMPHKSRAALLVAAADKLHNARSVVADLRELGGSVWDRFNAKKDVQFWFYTEMVRGLREAGMTGRLVDELADLTEEMKRVS